MVVESADVHHRVGQGFEHCSIGHFAGKVVAQTVQIAGGVGNIARQLAGEYLVGVIPKVVDRVGTQDTRVASA